MRCATTMPLNRSPPNKNYDSEPNLASCKERDRDDMMSLLVERPKRKRDEMMTTHEDDLCTFMEEMKRLLSNANNKQDLKFKELQKSLQKIERQNEELSRAMEFMSAKYDEMKNKLESMEAERKSNQCYIKELENRVEKLEKNTRAASIEVRNVPVNPNETKEDLVNLIKNVGSLVNLPVDATTVKDIFRSNTKGGTKPIIAEFTTVINKEKFLSSVKKYRKDNKTLTTRKLTGSGPEVPIYISENLTPAAKKLLYIARQFSQSNNYRYCWTSHGNIYMRRKDGETAIRVNCEEDIKKLTKST